MNPRLHPGRWNTALSLGILALLLVATASADWVVEIKDEQVTGTGTIVMKLKAGKLRKDDPNGLLGSMSFIYDPARGDWITLAHSSKRYDKNSAAEMKRDNDATWSKIPAKPGPLPKFEDTGKKEKVGKFECEIFSLSVGRLSERFWVSANYPHADILKTINQLDAVVMPSVLDYSKLPGVPLKKEINYDGRITTQTVISIKEQDVAASEFEVPAGYTPVAPAASGDSKPAPKAAANSTPSPGAATPANPAPTAGVPPAEGVAITLTAQNAPGGRRYGAGFPATQMPANPENYFWVVERPDNQTKIAALHNNQWHFSNLPGRYKIQVQYRSGAIQKTVSNVLEITIPGAAAP